jgi:hypothetical protein
VTYGDASEGSGVVSGDAKTVSPHQFLTHVHRGSLGDDRSVDLIDCHGFLRALSASGEAEPPSPPPGDAPATAALALNHETVVSSTVVSHSNYRTDAE